MSDGCDYKGFAMTTQSDAIEAYLTERKGEWVSMPALVDCSGSYNVHSRVSDLRGRGLTIENKVERCPRTGTRLSYYRIPDAGQTFFTL